MADSAYIVSGPRFEIRYLEHRGLFRARDYLECVASKEDRARFRVLARKLADLGQIANRQHFHRLKPPYQDLWEFKPNGSRIFGFFFERTFYVVSGARKAKPRVQAADYAAAMAIRGAFLQSRGK